MSVNLPFGQDYGAVEWFLLTQAFEEEKYDAIT